MRRLCGLAPALLALALATATVITSSSLRRAEAPVARESARESAPESAPDLLASLPVSFEPVGDDSFASRGAGYSLTLTGGEAVLGVEGGRFRLRPAGPSANRGARLVGDRPLGGTVTRLVGDDPAAWRTGLPTYGRVEARQVWPGVDLVWHGDQRRLEHDVVVAPGVDPAVVALDVEGAASLSLDASGDLAIDLGGATTRLARPVLYQDVAGERRKVPGAFTLLGPSRIGFEVGPYDRSMPLVIDPTLVTSTFLGGSGNDSGYAIALDAAGNTYVTGSTESADFPAQGALSNAGAGPTSDVFVSKVSADGGRLIWSMYLGGGGRDTGYALATGADGSVYVSGVTESADFPRARAAQDAYGGGPSDAFVAKLAGDGTSTEWSTFVGGAQTDRARGVAVDSAGNAYLTGSTNSVNFPAVGAYQPGPFRPDDLDAFLVKVPAAGAPIAYATRLGGSNDDHGLAVAVDAQGSAYVTGDTLSPGFPTVRPIQAASGGSAAGVSGSFPDAFVSKFDAAGAALVYSTFLGGSDVDQGTAIAVDTQGAAYVVGNTNSPNLPTAAPLQPRKDNDVDAFVAKIDAPGAALVYSTYVGGAGADGANGVSIDAAGNAYVVGTTGSGNWPIVRPVQADRGGAEDAFVMQLNASGGGPLFSTFVGGREADAGMGVALDRQGRIHVLGLTSSADFPSVRPVQPTVPPAAGDAFVATLDLAEAAARAPAAGASPATSPSSTSSHDRRVRALGGLTLALLLAAVLQTAYLRRRPATAGKAQPARPTPKPMPKPEPKPKVVPPSASPGVKVLHHHEGEPSGARSGTPAKAGGASKSTRAPKARGGPKTGPAQKRAGAEKAAKRTTPSTTPSTSATPAAEVADDGGPPTAVTTPPSAPPPPKPKPQEPAVAQLLEEDMWAPEPRVEAPAEPEPAPPSPISEEDPETETQHEDASPPPPAPPRQPGPAIPPVPAEELSFWDLFPEDLPPARRAGASAAEDARSDRLALPEGPDSAVDRLLAEQQDEAGSQVPGRSSPPPDPEIAIAELLDGPLPTGMRPSGEFPWGQAPADDIVVSDLLVDRAGEPASRAADAGRQDPTGPESDGDDDGSGTATTGITKEEQARIAADRARRRRSRRSGRRKPGSG